MMNKPPENLNTSTSAETAVEKELPLWRVFFYGLGNAAGLLTYQTFNAFVAFFYTDYVKVPSQWVGRGWFAFGFWNAINDPIAGWLSDRTQSKVGRRTFYIRLLAIPVAIAFALIWLPPFDVKTDGITPVMVYFLVIISIYDILQSIIILNQDALFPEMFHSTKARSRAAAIRQIVGFVFGVGIAVVISPRIYDGALGWTGIALLWSSVAVLLYFLSLIGIQENPAYAEQSEPKPIWSQFRIALQNKTFLVVLLLNFVLRFVVGVLLLALPFYAKYVLQIGGSGQSTITGTLLFSVAVSLLVWQWIYQRLGTRRALIIAFFLSGICALPLLFTTGLVDTAIALGILGIFVGGTVLAPDLLFAELIDEDYVKTGIRREGLYRGILGFMFRFPPAFAGLILGELLASSGYDADLAVDAQPESFVTVMRIFTAASPLIAVVLGIILMGFYPLYGERLQQIQRRASALRTAMRDNTHSTSA